ncbi:MAG TPA: hypothetical protein VFL91_31310 [Thermomicrobiales bacterium]|nr:hypothetical protein [Thermomicrobiales bacterium]
MGVIDAIADGCFAVARRPYVLIPPVALDLFYWLGDRLTARPLIDALIGSAQRGGTADPATIDGLRAFEHDSNLFSLLALGMKALLPALTSDQVARPWAQGTLDLGAWPLVLLGALGLVVLGLLALAFYLAGLAQLVRGEPFDLGQLARRAPVYWLRLLGLGALVIGALILLGLPLLFCTAVLLLVGANPAPLVLLFFVPVLWLYCYLALAPEAIVISDVGPLRAVKLSFRVVRRNFWPMIGLLAATLLISQGFPFMWELFTRQVVGVPLAIVGNAFLGAGLTAAAMYFYRERLALLDKSGVGSRESEVGK